MDAPHPMRMQNDLTINAGLKGRKSIARTKKSHEGESQKTPEDQRMHAGRRAGPLDPTTIIRKDKQLVITPSRKKSRGSSGDRGSLNGPSKQALTQMTKTMAPTQIIRDLDGPSDRDKCQVDLDSQGFYSIRIQYAHCTDIANGSGLPTKVVLETVDEDNL